MSSRAVKLPYRTERSLMWIFTCERADAENRAASELLRLHADFFDDVAPLFDLALHERQEFSRRSASGLSAVEYELLAHFRQLDCGVDFFVDALHDRGRHLGRAHEAQPVVHVEPGVAL